MEARGAPDDALWRRALEGDGDAFGAIFDAHRDRVFAHCLRALQSFHDAEDATAVAFLELWRKRADARTVDGSILPWLLVTATNTCRNLHRSRRRYQRVLQRLPRSETAPSAEDRAELASELSPELAVALERLGAADARLFALVALEGYSPAEAAVVLGRSSGAVRTRLHRIRTRLRAHLEPEAAGSRAEEAACEPTP
ncbi:RNA polymerase sigma factor [Leucobacter allii]|uniref:RNA polymerase sigma factor n=1 Tax=Leucobacter allii TaxID=2932247 RepID=A0ABY4FLI9_9MICO|nr:RNA polymerase sigma factor [Leucobacter allii]UOQ57121.1 RNA polymerase sigma factor [Leucobacter allii]